MKLRILQTKALQSELEFLRIEHGLALAAMVLGPGAQPLARSQRPRRLGILLGNEATGLEPKWVNLCDELVTIPMSNDIDSLNVAVASGVVLHHYVHGATVYSYQ